jgi:hypothetical protein
VASKFVVYLEFTLPAAADIETLKPTQASVMDSFQTLRRVFAELNPVLDTRLLRNTEDPRVILLEVTSTVDILEQVRSALNVPGVKTRAWAFEVMSEQLVRELAQA